MKEGEPIDLSSLEADDKYGELKSASMISNGEEGVFVEMNGRAVFPRVYIWARDWTKFLTRYNPIVWIAVIVMYILTSCIVLGVLYRLNYWSSDTSEGRPLLISCYSSLWYSTQRCGFNGFDCAPFDNVTYVLRCPPSCMDPHSIQNVIGDGVYRADSYLCSSAIHSGVIGSSGGCFAAKLAGSRKSFTGSNQNGVQSFASSLWFPKSFRIEKLQWTENCIDLRWVILSVNIALFVFFSLLCSAIALHGIHTSKILLIWWTCLVSSAAVFISFVALDRTEFPVLAPFFNMIPAFAVFLVLFTWIVHPSIYPMHCFIELLIFYTAPFYFGVFYYQILSNFVPNLSLDNEFFSRLTQNGITAFIIICILLAAFIIHSFRLLLNEHKVNLYILSYVSVIVVITAISVSLYSLNSRLYVHMHHYILSLLLLPFSRFRNPVSIIFQGFLLGMLVNGVFIWGFDNLWVADDIIQPTEFTSSDLFFTNYTSSATNISIAWTFPSQPSNVLISFQLGFREVYRGMENSFFTDQVEPNSSYLACLDFVRNGRFLGPGCRGGVLLTT